MRSPRLAPLAVALLAACSSAPPIDAKAVVQEWVAYMNQDHVLVPGDILDVTIPSIPVPPTHRVTVSAEGAVSLPGLAQALQASGRTMSQFRQQLIDTYSRTGTNPGTITVTLATPSSKSVYVLGEVAEPGPVAWNEQMSLAKAVASTGGTIVTAKPSDVYITRADPVTLEPRYFRANLTAIAYGESMDFPLLPGDLVFVQTSVGGDVAYFVDLWVRRVLPLEGIGGILGAIAFAENRRD
jgi:polysaccharide export outer membrane protein